MDGRAGISVNKCPLLAQVVLALKSCFCPQARSPFPAPTAAVPLPTAPTFGPTCRPTQMSRSISARHAPEPSPACPCCTSTRSQAAQGAPADPQGASCASRPPPASQPLNSRKKVPPYFSLPRNSLLSSPVWLSWPRRALRTMFQFSLPQVPVGSEGGLAVDMSMDG